MDETGAQYLGINVGGTACSLVVGDANGYFSAREEWKTRSERGLDPVLAELVARSGSLLSRYPVQGIGVSIGGPLDTAEGRVLGPPNLPGWDDVPLKAILKDAWRLPVAVAHDAAACALAEWRFGSFSKAQSLVYLTCGTGFGAGVVVNGQIHQGAAGRHPEIGHWRVMEDGPVAFGKVGSAEAVCSGPGLSRLAAWMFPQRWAVEPPTPENVSSLSGHGDPDARAVMAMHARKTGEVCAKIAELLCPEVILLGSLSRHLGASWTDCVRAAYRSEVLPRIGETVRVLPASLGERLQDLSALVVGLP